MAALTVIVYTNPRLAIDAAVARALQSVDLGPLSPLLDFYRQIGGPYAVEAEAVVFAIILTLNRASWRLLVSGALVSGWYFLLVRLISRPRPTVPDVLHVTEHPGASSYPSGHMILFVFYAVILMTCLGLKFIPRRWQPLGWAIAFVFVLVGAFSRIYSGAHWPTDVLGGILIAIAWLSTKTPSPATLKTPSWSPSAARAIASAASSSCSSCSRGSKPANVGTSGSDR